MTTDNHQTFAFIKINFSNYQTGLEAKLPESLTRKSEYLSHPVFNRYHSETKMMRYIKELEKKDLSLTTSMIPLGSCTMKLNPATAMVPVSWPEFSKIHPFVPKVQVKGYLELITDLEKLLCEITGFQAASLQPNSGAQGEYTGLSVIRAYHKVCKQGHRNVNLIPTSAHGTNPASAVMAGMKVVLVNCLENGDIDVDDLRKKAEENKDQLAALMVTYPGLCAILCREQSRFPVTLGMPWLPLQPLFVLTLSSAGTSIPSLWMRR